jgi:hypothetical protein
MKKLNAHIYKGFIKGDLVYIKDGCDHAGTNTKIIGFYRDPETSTVFANLAPVISTATAIVDEWMVPLSDIELLSDSPDLAPDIYNKLIMIEQYRASQPPAKWDGIERRKTERPSV